MIARVSKGESSMPALLRSHPAPESRIAALRRQAATLRPASPPASRVAAAPPLPAPADPPSPPAPVAVSELFPLTVGMSWTYPVSPKSPARTRGQRGTAPGAAGRHDLPVLEQQPGHPGVFRLRTEMDGGLAWTRLVTVTSGGTLTLKDEGRDANDQRATADRALRLSAFAARPQPRPNGSRRSACRPRALRTVASETVRVPAGEYQTIRAVQRSPGGETATVWLAPGVGIVRRAWDRTGLVEELEAFRRPCRTRTGTPRYRVLWPVCPGRPPQRSRPGPKRPDPPAPGTTRRIEHWSRPVRRVACWTPRRGSSRSTSRHPIRGACLSWLSSRLHPPASRCRNAGDVHRVLAPDLAAHGASEGAEVVVQIGEAPHLPAKEGVAAHRALPALDIVLVTWR